MTRTKIKAICVICNAQVKYYSKTTNLWKHRFSAVSEWRMAQTHCVLFTTQYTHTKAWSLLAVFTGSAVSLYDDMNTRISSPAAPKVTLLAFDYFIWENYRHITYTAAASSSWQPVKIKVWFNVKKLWQKYISLLCIGEKLSQWTDSFDVVFSHFLNQIFFTF